MKSFFLTLVLAVTLTTPAPAQEADTSETLIIQMRMGGALPQVKFRWMSVGNDFKALKRVVYREKAPVLEAAALVAEQMTTQFPYGVGTIGIGSDLAAQRAWLLRTVAPFLQSIQSDYFQKVVHPALGEATASLASTNVPDTRSAWHSAARLGLSAAALKGLLLLSLRTQDVEPVRNLNVEVGKVLARSQGGAVTEDERETLRSTLTKAQSQLDSLMLSPRARALATFLQAVLNEETRG